MAAAAPPPPHLNSTEFDTDSQAESLFSSSGYSSQDDDSSANATAKLDAALLIRRLSSTVRDRHEVVWELPPVLHTPESYLKFSSESQRAYNMIKYCDDIISSISRGNTPLNPQAAFSMCIALDTLITIYEDYWFTRHFHMDSEAPYLEADLLSSKLTAWTTCSIIHKAALLSLVSVQSWLSTTETTYYDSRIPLPPRLPFMVRDRTLHKRLKTMDRILKISAFDIPHLAQRGLAMFNKPIMQYSTDEMIRACDGLAHRFSTAPLDEFVTAYIMMLCLKLGLDTSLSEFQTEQPKSESTNYSTPMTIPPSMREEYAISPEIKNICTVSTTYREQVAARLDAFVHMIWLSRRQPRCLTIDAKKAVLQAFIIKRQRDEFYLDDDERSPAVSSFASPAPKRPSYTIEHLGVNPDVAHVSSVIRSFNVQASSVNIVRILQRFYVESSATGEINQMFMPMATWFSTSPGDMASFKTKVVFASRTPGNAIRVSRGERVYREFLHLVSTIDISVLLSEALEKVRNASTSTRLSYLEEICIFCVFSSLMKRKYELPWDSLFFVTSSTYARFESERRAIRGGTVRAPDEDIGFPCVSKLTNEYSVLFEGRTFDCANIAQSLAYWIFVIGIVHDHTVPIPSESDDGGADVQQQKREIGQTTANIFNLYHGVMYEPEN